MIVLMPHAMHIRIQYLYVRTVPVPYQEPVRTYSTYCAGTVWYRHRYSMVPVLYRYGTSTVRMILSYTTAHWWPQSDTRRQLNQQAIKQFIHLTPQGLNKPAGGLIGCRQSSISWCDGEEWIIKTAPTNSF